MTTSPPATQPGRSRFRPAAVLRLALRLDAAVSGINGAAYLLAAPLLVDLLGLSTGLLRAAGVFLLVFATSLWAVAARPTVSSPAAGAVVAVNALWVVGSLVAVASGFGSPTTTGTVWLLLQAAVVAAFATVQFAGLPSADPTTSKGTP